MISLRISALALVLMSATMQAGLSNADSSQSAKSKQDWDPSKPPKGAGGLEGLYWGSMLENTVSAFGGMSMKVTRAYVLFFPNGQFFDGLPLGGQLSAQDFAESAKKFPNLCGIYRLQGNNIIIQLLSNSNQIVEHVLPFRRIDANHIEFSLRPQLVMRRAEPAHDLHLSGLYTFSNLVSAGRVNVNTATFIEFSPDGRYRQSGLTSVRGPRVVTENRGPQTGRYKIEGFRLTLTPDNESPQYLAIVLTDPSPATTGLFINDQAFLKR